MLMYVLQNIYMYYETTYMINLKESSHILEMQIVLWIKSVTDKYLFGSSMTAKHVKISLIQACQVDISELPPFLYKMIHSTWYTGTWDN